MRLTAWVKRPATIPVVGITTRSSPTLRAAVTAYRSRYDTAPPTASMWAAVTRRAAASPLSANTTLADLGALKVRSNAATVVRPEPMGAPVRGCLPWSSRWKPAGSSGPSRPSPTAAAPTHRAVSETGNSGARSER